jgi:hypothetical protein
MKLLGRGVFLEVRKSKKHEGKVEKKFRFPLREKTAKLLKEDHDTYTASVASIVNLPRTEMHLEPGKDGWQVTVLQDDLSGDGMLLSSFLSSAAGNIDKLNAYEEMLDKTLGVFRSFGRNKAIKLGIESNPNNWWVRSSGPGIMFFDTVPPLVCLHGEINRDVLVMQEDPTFFRRVMAFLSRFKLTSKLAEKTIRKYAFDWPTTVRTLLVKTIACTPQLKDDLIRTARKAIDELGIPKEEQRKFQKKLSSFSIRVELFKLRMFNWLDNIGK